MLSKSLLINIAKDSCPTHHLGYPKDYRDFVPETRMKTKYYMFLFINPKITNSNEISKEINWMDEKKLGVTKKGLTRNVKSMNYKILICVLQQ